MRLRELICVVIDHSYRLRDNNTVFRQQKISYCERCSQSFSIDEIRYKNRTITERATVFTDQFKPLEWFCAFTGHEYTLMTKTPRCMNCDIRLCEHDRIRILNGYDCLAWRLRRLRERKESHDQEEICKRHIRGDLHLRRSMP